MTPRPDKYGTIDSPSVNERVEHNEYTEEFFQKWLDDWKGKIQDKLPKLDVSKSKFFTAACQHVQDCNDALTAAEQKRDEIKNHKPVDEDALKKAEQAVQDASDALDEARQDAMKQALPLLDFLEEHKLEKETRKMLVVSNVLIQATPKGLAEYCNTATEEQANSLVQLLQDDCKFDLLQEMVVTGGAKAGKYGRALEIYTALEPQFASGEHPILQRLAMATALELAEPLKEFHQDEIVVDPIKRYLHYEQAWMFGELDPAFEDFSTWELRGVINSVAPDDQLGWGRQMLMNYRPDLMQLNDKWRYCRLVRTDIGYTMDPNWPDRDHLDFKQIFSGGGACGPRAWGGRFICKAFGIPTWGVKEPGHAAMARWTQDEGWVVCLGAEMKYAWWDDQCGLDFRLDADARDVCSKDKTKPNTSYGEQVLTIEWIADLMAEPSKQVHSNYLVDPEALWRSLTMMQKQRLVGNKKATNNRSTCMSTMKRRTVTTKLEKLLNVSESAAEHILTMDDGTIVIPAAVVDQPKKPNDNVLFMDSFLGGKQLFLNKDGHVEYLLTSPPGGKYKMTCKFATLHDDKQKPPLLVTIDAENDSSDSHEDDFLTCDNMCSIYSIPLPYTDGMWQETEPITVDIPSNLTTCKISLTREDSARGLAVKEIKLIPANPL